MQVSAEITLFLTLLRLLELVAPNMLHLHACVLFAFLISATSAVVLPMDDLYNHLSKTQKQRFQNGSAVPGDSPIFYNNDPSEDLFEIESLNMYPNPCVMYVNYSGSQNFALRYGSMPAVPILSLTMEG